ncbi:GntR family transcriptional regulator [Aurantiacibacter marinus]|uniref:GntR family transcriptional regulator n=1 Tax=Aurantiacibacter marinus TaxID=874156 RepID=A0A0H0XW42_9SPHN|nr:GntR family transcriptional regulator [Aurantiacibacter marinus]KLI64510.1 GntR family transcriptional regulator [Aurantiacibacter marinus]
MSRASDRAFETIRSMIVSGELSPGEQLVEEALADRCGVSRTPVRDALRRLESDMLVRRNDTQRTFVADWSLDDVADMFELRAMLEGHAAKLAAERMSDAALEELRRCNAELRRAVKATPPNVDLFLELNRDFHALILKVASSRRLATLLATLIEQPVIWRTAHHYGVDELARSSAEHDELLAAFARKDADWAQSIMSGHIRRAYHAYADAHHGLTAIDAADRKRRA